MSEPSALRFFDCLQNFSDIAFNVAVGRVDLSDCYFHFIQIYANLIHSIKLQPFVLMINDNYRLNALMFSLFFIIVRRLPRSLYFTSSMTLWIKSTPRPEVLKRFSGSVGSGMASTSKPSPSSSMVKRASFGETSAEMRTILLASNLLPCLTALTKASSKAIKRFEFSGFIDADFFDAFHQIIENIVHQAEIALGNSNSIFSRM